MTTKKRPRLSEIGRKRTHRPCDVGRKWKGTPRGTIRVACIDCDREDADNLDFREIARLLAEGWEDITQVQTYEESITTYPIHQAPADYDCMAWYTHLGTCPDCKEGD